MKTRLDTLLNSAFLRPVVDAIPDNVKSAWRGFSAQPGNTHIAVAAVLLLGLVLTVTLVGSEQPDDQPVANQRETPATGYITASNGNAVDAPTPAVEVSEAATPEETLPDITALVETTMPDITGAVSDNSMLRNIRLVIILDDIGYNAEAGERAVNLPGAVTYAVLPFTPHGQALAQMAHEAGKEVMLHAPMSNLAGMALGEGGLTLTLSEEEFISTLRAAIADIPHIAGVNNHTGSELTAAEQPMQWVMRELKAQGLFFVDSMTTGKSVAEKIAIEHQVPALKRHVFLDNEATVEAIDREFRRALAIAQQQGFAVAIGHPYPATLEYLEQAIIGLAEQNITLVPASDLLVNP